MRSAEKRSFNQLLSQRSGLLFVACVFFFSLQAGLYAGHRDSHSTPPPVSPIAAKVLGPESKNVIKEHPIPKLMAEAEDQFRSKLSKQSTTLRQAVVEYKRRYKRNPPKGFDRWWEFAQKNHVMMVDEFDGLVEDLAPFWELSGEELRRRALQVSS